MPEVTRDLRDSLPTATLERTQPIARAQYLAFTDPTSTGCEAGPTWLVRGRNAVFLYIGVRQPGEVISETFTSEVCLLLLSETSEVEVSWQGMGTRFESRGCAMIPPGEVKIRNTGAGDLLLLIRSDEGRWAERSANASQYEREEPRTAAAIAWPEPVGDPRVRFYAVDDYPLEEGKFGRIFRSQSFMVNFLASHQGPRPRNNLSPHYHDDFEQYSLATEGAYVHHIRTPWLRDRDRWVEDEHTYVGAPSLTVIPPPTVHTSEAVGASTNTLIDIFCPPREDFSSKDGWVRNAEEYPAHDPR